MSGIYLHVPFCRTACHYCDFHFSTSMQGVDSYVEAVCAEIELRAEVWGDTEFQTLYFGGGTPSVLSVAQTERITRALAAHLRTPAQWREATIEVNPEDVTREALEGWLKCGFDRISIGVQSFEGAQLEWMNRKHSAELASEAVLLARDAGFAKISVDLIYGLPFREEVSWERTINRAFELPIDHISCYALTVEPKTVLGAWVKSGKVKVAEDELVQKDYDLLCGASDFVHYEVSNWARNEENKAVHNSSYWRGAAYLGLGPGAHGFDGTKRYSVVSNNHKYIDSISKNVLPDEVELLSKTDRSNELLMTGLRTSEGVDFDLLKTIYGIDHVLENQDEWRRWVEAGAIVSAEKGRWRISEKHWLIGDSISSDLISLKP